MTVMVSLSTADPPSGDQAVAVAVDRVLKVTPNGPEHRSSSGMLTR
jgi:hypothetical protein